jgi:hypothetical protein
MIIAIGLFTRDVALHHMGTIGRIAIQVNHAIVDGDDAIWIRVPSVLLQKCVPAG